VTISARDRKILWARSGNRCAICKLLLIADRTDDDAESVVGDEAHIAARSAGGPRYGECDPAEIDTYANLILLCKVHHKIIDDQVGEYTSGRIRRVKSTHEAWVEASLTDAPETIHLKADATAEPLTLVLLRSGSDLWNLVTPAHAYVFEDLDESGSATDSELDQTAEFLQLLFDWGEISSDVTDHGMGAVRDAKRSLAQALSEVMELGLRVFGGRRRRIITGGVMGPAPWVEAVVAIVRADDERIVHPPSSSPSPR
jgi:hypothetical protein